MSVQHIPSPRLLRADNWVATYEIACADCGGTVEFTLGVHRLVASAWYDELAPIDHCPCCGMPLPDERDTASTLRTLRAVAA